MTRPSDEATAIIASLAQGAFLDALAQSRAYTREPGETDEDLRDRILGKFVVRTVEEA